MIVSHSNNTFRPPRRGQPQKLLFGSSTIVPIPIYDVVCRPNIARILIETLSSCIVLRCLGLPARSITNFDSAHDTDFNRAIDKFYDENGKPISSSDSIWWVDCHYQIYYFVVIKCKNNFDHFLKKNFSPGTFMCGMSHGCHAPICLLDMEAGKS